MTDETYEASGVTHRPAGPEDDAALRAILRSNIMDGWVRLSFECEPSYFQPLYEGENHQAIIGRETDTGKPVGMYARSVRHVYVNGKPGEVGYLSGLRVMPGHRNRIRIIRDGFAALKLLLHEPYRTPYYLTAILTDNTPARRLLEAGLTGLPAYQPYADLTTLVFSTNARAPAATCEVGPGRKEDSAAIAALLESSGARHQFAPVWKEADLLERRGGTLPTAEEFIVARKQGRIVGCLGLWDQSAARQVVVRGYDRKIEAVRPFLNFLTPVTRLPQMPKSGSRLKQVFLSHLATENDDPATLVSLVAAALKEAHRRGFTIALLALADTDARLQAINARIRARRIESKVYIVHWPEAAGAVSAIDDRPPQFEAGLL